MPTMATTQRVRDVMTRGVDCASVHSTITEVAQRMRAMGVGAMPVLGDDERLVAMISDRDIVISCVAVGLDPRTTEVGEIVHGDVVTIRSDANLHAALRTMAEHGIRRLPVVDHAGLVGIIAERDLARHLHEKGLLHLLDVFAQA